MRRVYKLQLFFYILNALDYITIIFSKSHEAVEGKFIGKKNRSSVIRVLWATNFVFCS